MSCSAGTSVCETGELLSELWQEQELEPSVMGYSAGITACETGEQWQRAPALLSEPRRGEVGTQRHEPHR